MHNVIQTETSRGFTLVEFIDHYKVPCVIQCSSLAMQEAIWLGVEKHCMHLTRADVARMIPYLESFAETGELAHPEPSWPGRVRP